MKKYALIGAALLAMILPLYAQGAGNPFIVTIVDVPHHGIMNVRKQARNSAPIVGRLNEGVQVFTAGECWNSRTKKLFSWHNGMPANTTGLWCNVQMPDGGSGWVLVKYLQQG
jgi:hypothetical protein